MTSAQIKNIFKVAAAAGWNVDISKCTIAIVGAGYKVTARHSRKWCHNFVTPIKSVAADADLLRWLKACAYQLEYTALPLPGQDLTPKPFFTGMHYKITTPGT